jgi:hypothetical protein
MIRSACATPTHLSNGKILLDCPADGSVADDLYNKHVGIMNLLVSTPLYRGNGPISNPSRVAMSGLPRSCAGLDP